MKGRMNYLKRTIPVFLVITMTLCLTATGMADEREYNTMGFDIGTDRFLFTGNGGQNGYSSGTGPYVDRIPASHFSNDFSFSLEGTEIAPGSHKNTTNFFDISENYNTIDISNADYAKLYTAKVKTDYYYQKDYSRKAAFSNEVGELYQDWALKKMFYEATGKEEELKILDIEMNAELTALKAENTANGYGLNDLFSADGFSEDKELISAWQGAKETSSLYEDASASKGTQAANDTYWKNYYSTQAAKDADMERDTAERTAALNTYLANRKSISSIISGWTH